MICTTKITMVAKYLEDTSVDSQLVNFLLLSHTLSHFCTEQQNNKQLLVL